MDCRLALMCGTDVPVQECQLIIHQPTLNEISFIGEQNFFAGVQCLTLYKSMFVQDKDALVNINNFQIFMTIMQEEEAKDKKEAVRQVLTILFPTMQAMFTPNSLLFQSINKEENPDIILIDENNFEILQEYLRKVFCTQTGPMDQQAFNPQGTKAQEIAQKLMRGRERIAQKSKNDNISIFSQYLSVLSVGLSLPLKSLTELTMFQLYDLIERYFLWMNWDLDTKTRLAGGKPDDKPDNWMKSIHTN